MFSNSNFAHPRPPSSIPETKILLCVLLAIYFFYYYSIHSCIKSPFREALGIDNKIVECDTQNDNNCNSDGGGGGACNFSSSSRSATN